MDKLIHKKGFSTLEILIAMAVLSLMLSAIVLVSFGNQSMLGDGGNNAGAVIVAQEMLEETQALARKDFRLVNPLASSPDDIYTKSVDVVSTDYFTKKVTANVTWKNDHNRAQSTSISTLVTNFENAVGGDTCDSVLSGNWASPLVKNSNTNFASIVGDSSGTYTLTDIDVYKGKLYATSNSGSISGGPNNPNLAITTGSGLSWTSPDRVSTSNNSYATRLMSGTGFTQYIKATDFGLSIPTGATILGIKVEIEKSRSGGTTGEVRDREVKLVKADGSFGATNKANTSSNWSTTDNYVTYGGTSDLWDQSETLNWTPADLNSSNFGVIISAQGSSASTNRTANVDHIRITVTYIKSFYVLNISNPSSPSLVSGLSSNSYNSVGYNAVAVDGNFAYLAVNAGPASGQFQVIDLSSTPIKVRSNFNVPSISGTGSQGVGSSIFYKDGYVFLGLTKTASGPELNIIDVHDPSNPILVGSYAVGNGVNNIYVKNSFAYLATPNTSELMTLNVSDVRSPVLVGGYDAPDSVGNGKSLDVVGDKLYLGRTVTSSNPEFYVLDNTNPSASLPAPLGTKEISSSVNALLIRDYLAFLITTSGQFQIWNVSSPASITQFATPLTLPNSGMGIALDCEANTIFAASVPQSGSFANKGFLSIITSSP